MFYYAFTSLSTVGFGDYYPVNSYERIVIAFMLLFGVIIFSYIMGIFIGILEKFKLANAELEEEEELSRFFVLIQKFNNGMPIEAEFKLRIEHYMQYKWQNDKNMAITLKEKEEIMEQIPTDVQDRLYCEFLFKDFLRKFWTYF